MPDWFPDSSSRLSEMHQQFLEMLQDGRHMFDTATSVVLAGGDPETIRDDLFTTDQRINKTEQSLRREMVVHGTVHGTSSFPALLVLMSLTKDAERIGDYAKNIFGLARDGANMPTGSRLHELTEIRDRLSKMLVRAHGLFQQQDEVAAKTFIDDAVELQRQCESEVSKLFQVEDRNVAGEVLLLRFFKRVSSHVGNIITSIVVPMDKLDFYPGVPESEQ